MNARVPDQAPRGGGEKPRAALIVTTILSALAVPGGVAIAIPYLLLSWGLEVFAFEPDGLRTLGVVFVVSGIAMLAWCSRGFIVHGEGTPNPALPPRVLVARGLYRIVRNPMYVSMGLVVAGEALVFGSTTLLAYLVVLMAACHLFVTSYEEPTLRRLFGASYADYCERVPRWLPWPQTARLGSVRRVRRP